MPRDASQQIDYVRSKIRTSRVFTDTCTIYRDREPEGDGAGGFTSEPSSIEGVPCCYSVLSTYEIKAGGVAVIAGATHKLTFLPTTDIKAADKVVIAARGNVPELTFFVIGRREAATKALLYVDAKLDGETSDV